MNKWLVSSVAAASCLLSLESEAQSWTDSIDLGGDFRLRQEYIDQDGKEERNRTRIRARLSLDADVNEQVAVKTRFATGVDDPVSGNQSLDSGASTKDFGLDRFYLVISPDAFSGVKLLGGKMKNPFLTTKDLIFDGDLNPEGVALQAKAGEALELLLNAAVFAAEERSSEDDTLMFGGQAAIQAALSESVDVLVGGSIYQWDNTAGFQTLYDPADSFGNSSVAVLDEMGLETGELLYTEDYSSLEGFVHLKLDAGIPVKLYGSFVNNTEASGEDTGFIAGATLGKAKEVGSAELDVNYRDLEADAVLGAWTDSDSGGGGTGIEGVKVQGKLQVAEALQLSLSVFQNETSSGADYTRGQLDLIAKF